METFDFVPGETFTILLFYLLFYLLFCWNMPKPYIRLHATIFMFVLLPDDMIYIEL